LIGIVGEIYCRHNSFSNEDLVRKVEEHGGEVWLADVSEWVWYTIQRQRRNLQMAHRSFSKAMLGNRIRSAVQRADEHALLEPVRQYLRGLGEPRDVRILLEYCQPYLPFDGALGEMLLSIGEALYLYEKGADGVIDISPFTCMNGIICEAIYPRVSREHGGIPIRNFYFDGTAVDLECDVGIFMELAHNYQRRKSKIDQQRLAADYLGAK
jgi:predicted nucleotide-binding protein (sugar kinase/HSP70/actin superfamily)